MWIVAALIVVGLAVLAWLLLMLLIKVVGSAFK